MLIWQLPGTFADLISDSETNMHDLQQLSQEFSGRGTFWAPLKDFLMLEWGQSQLYSDANLPIIWQNFRFTFRLSLLSLFFTIVFSLSFFLFNKSVSMRLTRFLLAVPAIAIYPLVVFVSCQTTRFCPAGSLQYGKVLLLAAIVQGFLHSPRFFREIEWELEELRRQRFVLVLRAKGLSPKRIWTWHIAINILAPVLSLLLLTTLGFISGAILVEALFDLPGIGLLLLEALRARDLDLIFPLVMFLSLLHLLTLQAGRFLKSRNFQYE